GAIELPIPCLVHDAHPAAPDFAHDLVSGAAELRQFRDVAQPRDRVIGKPSHGATPRSARASARNSCSVAVTSRNASSTISRNFRRAAERSLVTLTSLTPKRSASSR